jgi:hypothetical protein
VEKTKAVALVRRGKAKFRLQGRFSTVTRDGRAIVLDTNRLLQSSEAMDQLDSLKQSLKLTTA